MSNSCNPVDCPPRHLCPWSFPGKNTGVGCHFFLQGVFQTQGSDPSLLHCRWIFYWLSHKGSPTVERVWRKHAREHHGSCWVGQKKVRLSFSVPAYGKKPEQTFWPTQYNVKNKALLYSVLLKSLRFNFLSNQTICPNMATFLSHLIADKMLHLWKDQ